MPTEDEPHINGYDLLNEEIITAADQDEQPDQDDAAE